jgi:hypothetical protein
MKRRDFFLFLLIAAVFSVIWIWLSPSATKTTPAISLVLATNTPSASTNGFIFQLKNSDRRAIFLSEIFVDVRTPAGWVTMNHVPSSDVQVVHPGETKDLPIASPSGNEPWRLRIAYGPQVEGFGLWMFKAGWTIEHRKLPTSPVEIYSGSNSVSSAEITR